MALLTTYRSRLVAAAIASLAATALAIDAPPPPGRPVSASDTSGRGGRQISLHDQLRVGLKAVTKADLAFINLVVLRVDEGTLPRPLVDSTFLWARLRVETRSTRYFNRPIVYFQPALVLRARALGIKL
jgi:hypothetical protein